MQTDVMYHDLVVLQLKLYVHIIEKYLLHALMDDHEDEAFNLNRQCIFCRFELECENTYSYLNMFWV